MVAVTLLCCWVVDDCISVIWQFTKWLAAGQRMCVMSCCAGIGINPVAQGMWLPIIFLRVAVLPIIQLVASIVILHKISEVSLGQSPWIPVAVLWKAWATPSTLSRPSPCLQCCDRMPTQYFPKVYTRVSSTVQFVSFYARAVSSCISLVSHL